MEASQELASDKVWSCHARDADGETALLDALPMHCWPDYDVRFPGGERRVHLEYRSIHSQRFAAFVRERLQEIGGETQCGRRGKIIDDHRVEFDDGASKNADGSSMRAVRAVGEAARPCGWRVVFGLEIEFEHPHGSSCPCLMDAMVPQNDGYRFFYTIPFSATRMLIEDTRYSDDPKLDAEASTAAIIEWTNSRMGRTSRNRAKGSGLPADSV